MKNDEPVKWQLLAVYSSSKGKVEDCLRKKPVLYLRLQNYRVPLPTEISVRKDSAIENPRRIDSTRP